MRRRSTRSPYPALRERSSARPCSAAAATFWGLQSRRAKSPRPTPARLTLDSTNIRPAASGRGRSRDSPSRSERQLASLVDDVLLDQTVVLEVGAVIFFHDAATEVVAVIVGAAALEVRGDPKDA